MILNFENVMIGLVACLIFFLVFFPVVKKLMKRNKYIIKMHTTESNGKAKSTDVEVDFKKTFNVKKKDLKKARKYIKEAIEKKSLKLNTRLEKSNEYIEKEMEKND